MQSDFERNVPFDLERSLELWPYFWSHPAALLQGLPFSLTLLTILLAHEFGHYVACRLPPRGCQPALLSALAHPTGTFGAFIRIRSPIYSKRALFDIGIAGPLAGFVFLLPALAIGIAFSKVIPGIAHEGRHPVRHSHLAVAAGARHFPGVRQRRYLPAPRGPRGLGGHVCHRA